MKFIRRDGQPVIISGSKCKAMVHQRKKPAKLQWTQAWRRLNKKGKDEGVSKKRSRKSTKIARAIVGASLDDLKKKTMVKKPKATDAGAKEVKAKAKAAKKFAAGPKGGNVPKIQRSAQASKGKR